MKELHLTDVETEVHGSSVTLEEPLTVLTSSRARMDSMHGGMLVPSLLQSTSFISEVPGKGSQPQLPDSAQLWFPQESLVVEAVGETDGSGLPSRGPPRKVDASWDSQVELQGYLSPESRVLPRNSWHQPEKVSKATPQPSMAAVATRVPSSLSICAILVFPVPLHWPSLLCSPSHHAPGKYSGLLIFVYALSPTLFVSWIARSWGELTRAIHWSELSSFPFTWFDLGWVGLCWLSWICSMLWGFSGNSDSSVCLQCGRPGFNTWVRKILWRRKWQPTPVLLPGKFHGRRSLVGYSPWGHKE